MAVCLLWWRRDCPEIREEDAEGILFSLGLVKHEADEDGMAFSKPEFLESDIREHEEAVLAAIQELTTPDYLSDYKAESEAIVAQNAAAREEWREALFTYHLGGAVVEGAKLANDGESVTVQGGRYIGGEFFPTINAHHGKWDCNIKGTRWDR